MGLAEDTLSVLGLLDLQNTLAAALFEGMRYPWEALEQISTFILALGPTLDASEFESPQQGVWIHRSARVAPSAHIGAPCIIDQGAEIRHCAYIRGSAIVGKRAVVGNSTELKNCVLFDAVQVPHYNYVGDSVLGHGAHMGAGSILSNVKADKAHVHVRQDDLDIDTGLRKFGAILGDFADIGCNAVLNPGTVIGRRTSVYPAVSVRGCVPEDCIFKAPGTVVRRV